MSLGQRSPGGADYKFGSHPKWSIRTGELLDRVLRGLVQTVKGIPAGFFALLPTRIQAGVFANAGTGDQPGVGWASANHVHDIETEAVLSLGEANAEGSGTALSRATHVHRLDVRVAKDGSTVGTRKRINLVGSFLVTDDAGNDEVDVEIDPTALSGSTDAWAKHFLIGF